MQGNLLLTSLRTLGAWAAALLLFFPLGWLFLTAFKTELQAIHVPPLFVFEPTLDNFSEVQRRSDYLLYARNSLITSLGSTLIGLLIAAVFHGLYNTLAGVVPGALVGAATWITPAVALIGFIVIYDGVVAYFLSRKIAGYRRAYADVGISTEGGEPTPELTEFDPDTER